LEVSPKALCDDCITAILGLTIRQHANQKTRELADRADFHRREARCSKCRKVKLVISHA
jgi:hypothetical protein